jgi:formiminoglutamase
MRVWTGRVDTADGPSAARWHQKVQLLKPESAPGVALVGFACDEGIRRNQGRVGAVGGPRAIRAELAGLSWQHEHPPVYDTGDVVCTDGNLEAAQDRLSQAVHDAIFARQRPLVLGGGHEAAWGSHNGLLRAVQEIDPNMKIGIINIDAHFDLRADTPGNSGTSFAQIAGLYREADRTFRYMCLGVSEPANTVALVDRALRFDTVWRPDVELDPWQLDEPLTAVRDFAKTVDVIHFSIDLDVLSAAVMPAVSAPAARGVPLASVETIIAAVLKTRKVALTDLVELSPPFDIDGHGARTAARLVWLIAKRWPLLVESNEPEE